MSPPLVGASTGLLFALGVLLAMAGWPLTRRPGLEQRLAPYLAGASRPSRLLADHGRRRTPVGVPARRLLGSVAVGRAAILLDRAFGGGSSVRRRLRSLDREPRVHEFRVEQVACGIAGLAVGAVLAALLTLLADHLDGLAVLLATGTGAVVGALGRDWWLTRQVRRREAQMLAELPAVAELLALAVTAGEGLVAAVGRVSRRADSELSRALAGTLARARSGSSLTAALEDLRDRSGLPQLARFLDGLVVAVERGTPLAEVLRAQAGDVRDAGHRALLESGGRRELAMMVPVVFLILPVTVLFALYPGLLGITQLTH